jgi:hypothetical protein
LQINNEAEQSLDSILNHGDTDAQRRTIKSSLTLLSLPGDRGEALAFSSRLYCSIRLEKFNSRSLAAGNTAFPPACND